MLSISLPQGHHTEPFKQVKQVNNNGEGCTDLNETLVQNPGPTYIMTVQTNVMQEAGIEKGDQVLVDRSVIPANGRIVVARVNNELIIRRFQSVHGDLHLQPAAHLASIIIPQYRPSDIWGVVTYVIRKC